MDERNIIYIVHIISPLLCFQLMVVQGLWCSAASMKVERMTRHVFLLADLVNVVMDIGHAVLEHQENHTAIRI
jgi:hypothetical protein